ncbi:MAG TPA: DUF2125 domain-containing protein [Xanthobacteraceae bacterium]|nr:DUF2125 domain-containing protein [Xanthobacteraceae bacterium]
MNTQHRSPTSRPWLIVMPSAILVLLGMIWSAFWYWSTTAAEATMTAWRAHEAEAGRVYGCATTNFGGYPFRIEVDCAEPSVDDRATALSIRAHNLAAVAQVWDPTLVIGEMLGPLTVAPLGGSPTVTVDWALAQASLRGTPGAPERLSIVIDKPNLATAPSGVALATAEHLELHGRFAAESTPGHPVLDLALDLKNATAPALVSALGSFGPLASASSDLSLVAVLRGASDLAPKPLGQRLREIQAAGGRLDITNVRLQQGDLIATATGALGLTARGTLSGDLRLTVVNFTKLVPLLGISRAVAQAVPQDTLNRFAPTLDRLMPGLANVLRSNAGSAGSTAPLGDGAKPDMNTALGAAVVGGQPTELEGQRAVTLTLRFDDGVAFLGPLKVGQVPPLY